MIVLIANSGSSTYKYHLYEGDKCVLFVLYQRVGKQYIVRLGRGKAENITQRQFDESLKDLVDRPVFGRLTQKGIDGMGFRVVHGGCLFRESVQVNAGVMKKLKGLDELAPLHNPFARRLVEHAEKLLPKVKKVLIFDTAFHKDISEVNSRYAIPRLISDKHRIQRYGFHGIAIQSVIRQVKRLRRHVEHVMVLHLGSGCSVTAVKHGVSVDTSMGFTPLEGLVMSTRSGNVDAGLLLYLQKNLKMSSTKMEAMLNEESGLKGLCGMSDMREIVRSKDDRAKLALEIFCSRAAKMVASMMVSLGGLDVIVFSGGIGVNQPVVRQKICEYLHPIGIRLDGLKNKNPQRHTKGLQKWYSVGKVFVVPSDEGDEMRREVLKFT